MGIPLHRVWLRLEGAPSHPLNDFLTIWSLVQLIDKTEQVDMSFTRAHGIARLKVGVLEIEFVPTYMPWTYNCMTYDLKVTIEGATSTA